jgi:hypothetical protein
MYDLRITKYNLKKRVKKNVRFTNYDVQFKKKKVLSKV